MVNKTLRGSRYACGRRCRLTDPGICGPAVVPCDEPGLSTVSYFSFARVTVHHTRGNDNRVCIEGGAQLDEKKRVTVLSSLRWAEQIVGREAR